MKQASTAAAPMAMTVSAGFLFLWWRCRINSIGFALRPGRGDAIPLHRGATLPMRMPYRPVLSIAWGPDLFQLHPRRGV